MLIPNSLSLCTFRLQLRGREQDLGTRTEAIKNKLHCAFSCWSSPTRIRQNSIGNGMEEADQRRTARLPGADSLMANTLRITLLPLYFDSLCLIVKRKKKKSFLFCFFYSDAEWIRTPMNNSSCIASHSVTDNKLYLQLNHFSWFFCTFLRRCIEGKKISLIPFLPDNPADMKLVLHVHLFDYLHGIVTVR